MSKHLARNMAIVGGVGAAIYLLPGYIPGNPFETPATKAVGGRFSAGGGTTTHTPAIATTRGNADKVDLRHQNPSGIDTEYYKENINSQRPGRPEKIEQKFYKAQNANEEGK